MIGGYRIIVSDLLPADPDWGKQAERIVRHGLADVLAWLGEDVGPEVDLNPIEVLRAEDMHAIIVSRRLNELLLELDSDRFSFRQRFMTGLRPEATYLDDTVEVNTVWGDYPARIIRPGTVGPGE